MYRREPIFAQSLTGLHRMPWIRWRGPSWTLEVTYIVAKPAQRQDTTALSRRIASSTMHGTEIEQHRVARLHLPLQYLQALLGISIWIRRGAVPASIFVEIALIGPVHRFYALDRKSVV